ncbi:uncharacterized protein LOC143039039 [Oratosquilla oratoria]|uniref:uncharacterized protein LOC143039039 n=1 Tax=Oratosquilla oratoria TaxID=337810 RepID=UPI003F765CB9
MTLVGNNIPQQQITDPVPCGEGVERLAVRLDLPNCPLTIYNIYRSPGNQLDAGELLSLASAENILAAGDFNAHHPSFQSQSPTNSAGRHLATLLEENPNIKLLNTGEPTHTRGGRLDLTFLSRGLATEACWSVHPTLTSDHYGVLFSIQCPQMTPPIPTPRWNIQRTNWGAFQSSLDAWWAGYSPPDSIEQRENLTAAIEVAAEASMPKKNPGRRHHKNWWFYTEKVREQNHRVNIHRRRYRRRPTRDDLERLREVVAHACQVSRRAKEDKWLEWCASFSRHTRLADLWSKLRTATGGSRSRPPTHPRPQQEAERLADNFAARCASSQLPAQVIQTLQRLRLERKRLIRDGKARPEPADCPFTHRELIRARRTGRDTATGADGVTYTMVAHAGPAGEQGILGLINHSWMIGYLPSAWKSADIQPIPKP